ncbi:MAG: sigma-70 family RNA polymerase sigma factor [Armatimonadetes bacterium]|nr:sigma-70 family RNA polymerase sigma factor [Armatimonadota bacterium]
MARRAAVLQKGTVVENSLDRFQQYARTREPALRDELVLEHLPLVERIARRYSKVGEPLEDVVQEGYIGLIKAVDQFNPALAVKFTTYATHIVSGEIRHYLRDLGRLIKEPAWLVELRFRVNRAAEELTQRLGRTPSPGEIAEQLGIPEEDVAEVVTTRAIFQVASLDEGPQTDGDEGDSPPLAERVTDTRAEAGTPVEERMVLQQSIRRLRKLERTVIYHFFYQEHSKTEIARKLDISVNYVSYLINRGLQNLKQILVKEDRREAVLRLEFLQGQLTTREGEFEGKIIIDAVTGLYVKPFFRTLVEDEVSRAKRYGLQFSMLFFTLSKWTELVERITEVEKDALLRKLAELLRRGLRDVDRVACYGQGIFAAILPHTGKDARVASERIRHSAKGKDLVPPRLKSIAAPALVCKVITYPVDGDTAQQLLELGEHLDRGGAPPRGT